MEGAAGGVEVFVPSGVVAGGAVGTAAGTAAVVGDRVETSAGVGASVWKTVGSTGERGLVGRTEIAAVMGSGEERPGSQVRTQGTKCAAGSAGSKLSLGFPEWQ